MNRARHPPKFCELLALLVGGAILAAGCGGQEKLPTRYGAGNGAAFEASVNGISVLAGMFAKAGHRVTDRSVLTPALKKSADTIVWMPDDFSVPASADHHWMEDWLHGRAGRTLIYIGRDFDAAPVYWRKIRPLVTPGQQPQVDRRLRDAEQRWQLDREQGLPPPENAVCDWFRVDANHAHRDVRTLSGPWSDGVDASKVEIELNSRLIPSTDASVLLASGDDVLASQLTFTVPDKDDDSNETLESHLIVVANGSFLVNLELVNFEHRRLAGKLIAAAGKPGEVVLIDSGTGNPPVRNSESSNDDEVPSMLDVFTVWPLSAIFVQMGILIAIFCFSRWPIFGPPRDPAVRSPSDFGRHITALGEMLELTRDSEYAVSRLKQYQQQVRGDDERIPTSDLRPPTSSP